VSFAQKEFSTTAAASFGPTEHAAPARDEAREAQKEDKTTPTER